MKYYKPENLCENMVKSECFKPENLCENMVKSGCFKKRFDGERQLFFGMKKRYSLLCKNINVLVYY